MAEKSALVWQGLSSLAATVAIIIALVTNTAVKIALAKKFWSPKFGSYVFRILWSILGVGVIVLGSMIFISYKNTGLISTNIIPQSPAILFSLGE
jgi:hypothetical protein